MNLDRIRAKKSYQIPEYHCKLEVDLPLQNCVH